MNRNDISNFQKFITTVNTTAEFIQLYDLKVNYIPQVNTSREMIRISQYFYILVNAKKLSFTVDTVDFQSKSKFFVEKNIDLQSKDKLAPVPLLARPK